MELASGKFFGGGVSGLGADAMKAGGAAEGFRQKGRTLIQSAEFSANYKRPLLLRAHDSSQIPNQSLVELVLTFALIWTNLIN